MAKDFDEFFSEKIPTGRRTYFIDVGTSRDGAKYIQFTESKPEGEGYKRISVIIFEEHVKDFLAALKKALVHFGYSEKQAQSHMDEQKSKFTNAYQPWSEEEDRKLETLFCEKKTVKELSQIFQRNTGAIQSRIKKLELREKYPK